MQFTESIEQLKAANDPQLGTVVTEATYVLLAQDGTFSDLCIRRVVFDEPVAHSFVNFADLTETLVLGWAKEKLGQVEIDAMKNGMTAKAQEGWAATPVDVVPPWKDNVETAPQ